MKEPLCNVDDPQGVKASVIAFLLHCDLTSCGVAMAYWQIYQPDAHAKLAHHPLPALQAEQYSKTTLQRQQSCMVWQYICKLHAGLQDMRTRLSWHTACAVQHWCLKSTCSYNDIACRRPFEICTICCVIARLEPVVFRLSQQTKPHLLTCSSQDRKEESHLRRTGLLCWNLGINTQHQACSIW